MTRAIPAPIRLLLVRYMRLFCASNVIWPGASASLLMLITHASAFTFHAPKPFTGVASVASSSGSTRQSPLMASPYHRWRTVLHGCVAPGSWQAKRPSGPLGPFKYWLGAVPCTMTPEVGKVTPPGPDTVTSSTPAHNVVTVLAL